MTQAFISLAGYRTGGVETSNRIRTGLAFDLTDLDLCGRSLLSAALHIETGPGTRTSAVRLTDPSDEAVYGHIDRAPAPTDAFNVALTTDAITDLSQASGAFFVVDAELLDESGEPQRLPVDTARHTLVLVVAEAAQLVAA